MNEISKKSKTSGWVVVKAVLWFADKPEKPAPLDKQRIIWTGDELAK